MITKQLSYEDYTVELVCALLLEMAAARLLLDAVYDTLPKRQPNDRNTYQLGAISGHNVVILCLPSGVYGTGSAGGVANQMLSSFHNIQYGLMVGIGSGVPGPLNDIRLGDIVVSKPTGRHGGVIQHDYGKATVEGHIKQCGTLNKPLEALLTAISNLKQSI